MDFCVYGLGYLEDTKYKSGGDRNPYCCTTSHFVQMTAALNSVDIGNIACDDAVPKCGEA